MPWYVAHTKPGKERQAVAALEQRQVEAYLPLLRKRKPRSGRCDSQPLFPGYVFACLEIPSACWLADRRLESPTSWAPPTGRRRCRMASSHRWLRAWS
jgi:transcription antitermination factor NusG